LKYAILTDLHANREATEAVLAHARESGVERWAFLGDYVGYGADPAWVVDTVREMVADGAVAVRGNHDAGAVAGPSPYMRPDAKAAIEWTQAQLNDEQRQFLADVPMTQVVDDILLVHANAWAPADWEYVHSRAEAARSMAAAPQRYTFCGHMHEPMLYHLSGTGKGGDFTPTPNVPIPLMPHRQWLVIPGSVGQPRDGNPAACYVLFDTDTHMLTFQRVPYDYDSAARKIVDAGLPSWLAERLADGR